MIRAVLDTNILISAVITELASLSYVVPGTIKIEAVQDPDDNMVIAAALEGNAEYIVSRDKDLTDLKEYEGIKIITPREFLEVLNTI